MHRRLCLIGMSIVAAFSLCLGCASSNHAGTGSADHGASASAAPSASSVPGSPSPTPTPTQPPGGSSSAPARSVPPSGPAATAATGAPPPLGKHAVAKIDGVSVACPDGAPYADPENGGGTRSALSADVAIKAVVRCETVTRTYPGTGQWSVQLAEVADSGFSSFLAELRKPSAKRPPDIVCPAYLRLAPWFALVDASGAVLQPAFPTDSCGQVSGSAINALNRLDFRAVDAVRVAPTS